MDEIQESPFFEHIFHVGNGTTFTMACQLCRWKKRDEGRRGIQRMRAKVETTRAHVERLAARNLAGLSANNPALEAAAGSWARYKASLLGGSWNATTNVEFSDSELPS